MLIEYVLNNIMYIVLFYWICVNNISWNMIADDILKTTAVDKLPTDMEGMEATMERLLALIDETYKYVDDVVVRLLLY